MDIEVNSLSDELSISLAMKLDRNTLLPFKIEFQTKETLDDRIASVAGASMNSITTEGKYLGVSISIGMESSLKY